MRHFIDITKDDLWTAIRNDRVITGRLKPKPYKNYRELTPNEATIVSCLGSTIILYMNFPNSEELRWTSMANYICEDYPELAIKHGLTFDRTHEYWRQNDDTKI